MAAQNLAELLPATRGRIVPFGLPVLYQNGPFNCACLAVDGAIVGVVAKRFLAETAFITNPTGSSLGRRDCGGKCRATV
ncbi:MAG: hypothetical protein ACLQU4_13175 [Limisphaerales bacterium]